LNPYSLSIQIGSGANAPAFIDVYIGVPEHSLHKNGNRGEPKAFVRQVGDVRGSIKLNNVELSLPPLLLAARVV
jgi:hypothetical protein